MYFFDGKHHIVLQSYENKMELTKALSNCESDVMLGEENASPKSAFYSVIIHLGWQGKHSFGMGLCLGGHGLKPHLLFQPDISQLLLGFNSEVVAVGVEDQQIHFRIRLESLFRSFLVMEPQKRILIFHEIGLVALDEHNNDEMWEDEVIEDLEITANPLSMIFMDTPPVSFNLVQWLQENEFNNPAFF